jgi:hypothetical protein
VRVTLTGLPPGARIRVDGAEVPGPSFDLAREDREAQVEVRATGYGPWRQPVSARESAVIPVRMRPATGRPSGTDAGRRSDAAVGGPTKTIRPFGEGP